VIVASLALILGAVILLVLGLITGSSGVLIGSIGTSLVAAAALVMGVRQAGAARTAADVDDEDEDEDEDEQFDDAGDQVWAPPPDQRSHVEREPQTRSVGRAAVMPRTEAEAVGGWADDLPPPTSVPSQVVRSGLEELGEFDDGADDGADGGADGDDFDGDEPPDEPAAQRVSTADAARVARLSAEVFVIDGRPRYHLGGCVHLLGRPFEPLPVSEAVELGFSPCGLCEPDSALIADVRRV
jgi:hypothetical protein